MHLFLRLCSSYLHDVTLKSEDGKEFPCHKSVLCARLGTSGTHVNTKKFIYVNMYEERKKIKCFCLFRIL